MSTYTDTNDVDNVTITRDGQGKLELLLDVPIICAKNNLANQTAAVPNVCSYTPTADTSFEVGGYVNIATLSGGTSPNIQIRVSFTDERNGPQVFQIYSYTTGSLNAVGFWSLLTQSTRAKANTAITILTIVNGAPTSLNYDVGAFIKKIP